MLRVLVLGELAVEVDGRPVPLPDGRPARALLGYLALHPGPHARAALAARLWPDVLDESARTSLRGALADVRRALGAAADGHLVATRGEVGLRGVETDAADAADAPAAAALALWRGPLLDGLEAGDWLDAAREGDRATRGALLSALADAAAAAGDHAGAVARARERVALEPLSEEAHRELIARLAAAGDRAAAVTAYERLAERLRRELRIAPSAPTRALVAEIRGGGAATHAGAGTARPALPAAFAARRERSPFVGRDAARDRLLAALDDVRDGERRVVVVSGEPGIGKSRLAAEAARAAYDAGATVLAGRCHEEPIGPFAPFVEALRPLGELHAEPAADPGAARLRLFDEVAGLLARAAVERPVLLVLDDLHWADPATLRLLAHLAAAPEPAALLLVGTYRQTDLGRGHPLSALLADLRREPRAERIALDGLDAGATASLIGGWVGDAEPGLADRVLAETEGNPFFIEEVLRDLLESGAHDDAIRVPESVREVIGRRVERLSAGALAALEAAAAYGREFDVGVLAAAAPEQRDALLDGLDEAERAQLVRPLTTGTARGMGTGRWAFSHALVRDAIYDELPTLRRARLHAAIADALVRGGGATAEAAHHAYEAAALDGGERAVALSREAAAEALAGLDYEAAAAHTAHALQALELDPAAGPHDRAAVLIEHGDALARAGDPGAVAAFAEARDLAAGAPELVARAALGACGVGVTIIDVDLDRAAWLEAAVEQLGDGHPGLRARLLARLAIELAYEGDRLGAFSEAAVDAARAAGDPDALLAALNARHVALWHPDGLGERLAVADEMIALAAAHDRPEDELQGRNWRAVDLWERGDTPAFEAELERYAALSGRLGLATFAWYVPMWRAALCILRGEGEAAQPLIAEAVAIGARAGDANAELSAGMLEFQRIVNERRFADFPFAFADAKIAGSPAGPAYRASRAWAAAELGRTAAARADVDWICADDLARLRFDFNWMSAIGELGEALAVLGDGTRAEQLYRVALPYADRVVTSGRAIGSQGSVEHTLGRLAATAGRPSGAIRHFRAAIAAQARIDARAWTVHTRTCLAAALDAAGDADGAAREAAAARAAAAALGLPAAATGAR